MVVLTDSETATGYRLAGVEVREATADDAVRELEEIITSEEYAL
ncbi:MAG TPA: V-type ATP synthase subunit F, partial [Trueperaceae bacterium]